MTLCSAFKVPSPANHDLGDVLEVNSFVGSVRSVTACDVPLVSSLDALNGASLRSVEALKGASVTSSVGCVTRGWIAIHPESRLVTTAAQLRQAKPVFTCMVTSRLRSM